MTPKPGLARLRSAAPSALTAQPEAPPMPPARLTPTERRVLEVLEANPGTTFDRDALCAAARLTPQGPLSRCLDAAVSRLRRKLGALGAQLETDFGTGYRWGPASTPPARHALPGACLTVPQARVHLDRRLVERADGCRVHLTTLEAKVLRRLAQTLGEPVPTQELGARGAVPKVVLQLRRKLGEGAISSTRALGYTLQGARSDDDVFVALAWEAAHLAGTTLGLEDVVVYRRSGPLLLQVAAWGPKCAGPRALRQPLRLPLAQGVVGACVREGALQCVRDTRNDGRYLMDLEEARSELAVPITVGSEVVGALDCEAAAPGAFTPQHQAGLEAVARMLALGLAAARPAALLGPAPR